MRRDLYSTDRVPVHEKPPLLPLTQKRPGTATSHYLIAIPGQRQGLGLGILRQRLVRRREWVSI